jgi:hypothetical protein
MPDPSATLDREAVTAAMRSASKVVPEAKPPSYGRLSDAEFQKEKQRLFGD